MDSEQMTRESGNIAEGGLQYTKDQWDEIVAQTEDYVRANSTRSLLYGVAAGFIASSSGSAMLAPMPLRTARREMCFLNRYMAFSVTAYL